MENLQIITYGVPQSLRLVLFSLIMCTIIRKHGMNFNCYADGTQIYISCRLKNTS